MKKKEDKIKDLESVRQDLGDLKNLFVTGYDGGALDAAYRGYPRCSKPFQPETIVAALTTALAG